MPFQEANRRDSWPPTILRLENDNNTSDNDLTVEDIDANPFAYFLTSPTPEEDDDQDFDFFDDLSAGIEGESPNQQAIREISPSSLQRLPLTDPPSKTPFLTLSLPLSLLDFTRAHEKRKREKNNTTTNTNITKSERNIAAAAMRGRGLVRTIPSRGARGRGQTRSLSGSRPHSWREPSPEINSIPEEGEGEDLDEVPVLGSDANDSEQESRSVGATRKLAKRVHWAALPLRD